LAVKEQQLSGEGKAESPLREGWRTVRFGDVARHVKVDADPETSGLERYVAGEHMSTDDLHIRSWGTIGDGYLGPAFHRKFVKGQVLYGSRRTYLRKVAVAEFDGICANTTFVIEPSGDELLPELLPFIMQTESFSAHAVKQSRGSVNPYVNWKDIAWYEFALPPKDEQRRIADILWAADEAIQKFENCRVATTQIQQLHLTILKIVNGLTCPLMTSA
jgi:type I restriction enzyme S subunit